MSVRKLPALIVAAGLLVSLTACAGGPFDRSGCSPTFPAGGNSALVTADGSFGGDPGANFPTPLVVKSTEVSVLNTGVLSTAPNPSDPLEKGDAELVRAAQVLDATATIYDGRTGASLITPSSARFAASDATYLFGEVATCAPVGSRVVAVGTAGELIGAEVLAANQGFAQLDVDATVVVVLDIERAFLAKANGADQLFAASGFPSVVLDPSGRPGFTFPDGAIPTDLRIANLKQGVGPVVAKGDSVVIHYTGMLWDAKVVFDSSWDRGVPSTFLAESVDDAQGGLVPGFAQALIGQRVGSQVVVVIPPGFGYPAGGAPASIPDGSTMVFVFDVLGIE